MNKKTLLGGLSAFVIMALFLGYPSIEKFDPVDQKPSTSNTDRVEERKKIPEEFSDIEKSHVKGNNSPLSKTNLKGISESELYQLKLKDSAEYFREAYRKKILEEDGEIKLYSSREEQKVALRDKLANKILTHLAEKYQK
jgi:hypothetical protein